MKLISRVPQKLTIESVTFTIKPLSRTALGVLGRGIQSCFETGDFSAMAKTLSTAIVAIDDPQAKKLGVATYLELIEDESVMVRLIEFLMKGNKLDEAEAKNSNSSPDGNSTALASEENPAATVESVS